MTIIFNLCCLAGVLICFVTAYHFREAFNRTKIEAFKNYSLAFAFVGLACLFLALPGLIFFEPFFVQITFIFSDVFFLGAMLFFGSAILALSKKFARLEKTAFLIIFSWIIIYIFLNFIFFQPANPLKINDIIYYWKSSTPWLQSITRGLICLATLIIASFFMHWTKIVKEKAVSRKSFLMGLSTFLITIAGFILWFFPFFYFSPQLLIFSGLLGLSGLTLGMVTGVFLFPPSREKSVNAG